MRQKTKSPNGLLIGALLILSFSQTPLGSSKETATSQIALDFLEDVVSL
jgi:hypothetical protein